MIEVLHLIDTYRIGGPGKTIINSARFIDRTRYRVHAAAFTHPDASRNEFAAALQAAGIPSLELLETRRFDPGHIRQLRAYIRARDIAIVHAHGYRSDVLAFLATRGMRRVRLVTTHHGWIRNNARQHLVTHAALFLSSLFDGVEVVSRPLRDELPRWLRMSSRVVIVPNGIVLDDYRRLGCREEIRQRFGLGPGDLVLAVIGRMSSEKGCFDMIEAFSEVAGKLPHAHLLLIGEGPLENEIRRRVEHANVSDRTHFTGHHTDVRPFYEAADLVVSPSHTEGVSNVILEAMAFEKPVVATRVGGTPEIVEHERSGLLVEAQKPSELAAAIVRLDRDPTLKALLVAGARQRVREHFAFEVRMALEQRFYEGVLAGRMPKNKTVQLDRNM
jgi:glycosyltransferase involved in cell wall biosynthesis